MPKKYTEAVINQHLQTLAATPARIAAAVVDRDEDQLKKPSAAGEWSAVQNIAHLRGCAEIWSYSIYIMLTLDDPQMAYVHPRDWVKRLGYDKLTFAGNFDVMKVERPPLLRTLRGLTFEQFGRSATFTNRSNRLSIFDQIHRMATHEDQHCDQIEALFSGA